MSAAEFPHTACAVCGHVLNLQTRSVGAFWVHALEEDKDHPAVPGPAESIRTNRLCDFCLASEAAWVLPAETYGIGLDGRSVGDWQCCADCAVFLERGDWDGVTRRAMDGARGRMPEEDRQLDVFEEMYSQLREHVTGPVRLAHG